MESVTSTRTVGLSATTSTTPTPKLSFLSKIRGGATDDKLAAPLMEGLGTGILTAVVAILASPAVGLSGE